MKLLTFIFYVLVLQLNLCNWSDGFIPVYQCDADEKGPEGTKKALDDINWFQNKVEDLKKDHLNLYSVLLKINRLVAQGFFCTLRDEYMIDMLAGLIQFFSKAEKTVNTGENIPVVRQQVKKVKFLTAVGNKIVETDEKVKKKCDAQMEVLNFVEKAVGYLTKLDNALRAMNSYGLTFIAMMICGIHNFSALFTRMQLSAANSQVYGRLLLQGEGGDDLWFSTLFQNNHTNQHAQGMMNRFFHMHREQLMNMNQQQDQEGGVRRELLFDPDMINVRAQLQEAAAILDVFGEKMRTLTSFCNNLITNVAIPMETFKQDVYKPSVDVIVGAYNAVLKPFEPVMNVIYEISKGLRWLKCPSILGFICDLDSIIVDFVEDALADAGFDINAIIQKIIAEVSKDLALPSLSGMEQLLPDNHILFNIPLLESTYLWDEGLYDQLMRKVSFNPFENAFQNINNGADINIPGIGSLEYRFASSLGNQVEVKCPANKVPFILHAERRTDTCPGDKFTENVAFPCGVNPSSSGETKCTFSTQDSPNEDCNPRSSSKAYLNFVYGFYTCVTFEQVKKFNPLPSLNSNTMDGFECAAGTQVVIDTITDVKPCQWPDFLIHNININLPPNLKIKLPYSGVCQSMEPKMEQVLDNGRTVYDFFTALKETRDTGDVENFGKFYTLACGGLFQGIDNDSCYNFEGISTDHQSTTPAPQYRNMLDYYLYMQEPLNGISFEWLELVSFGKPTGVYYWSQKTGSSVPPSSGQGPIMKGYELFKQRKQAMIDSHRTQIPSCVAALKASCDWRTQSCKLPEMFTDYTCRPEKVFHTCLLPEIDYSIPNVNRFVEVSFRESATLRHKTLSCPNVGAHINILKAEAGTEGQISPPSVLAAWKTACDKYKYCDFSTPNNKAVTRISYECLCGAGYEPIPDVENGNTCIPCPEGWYRTDIMDECQPCAAGNEGIADPSNRILCHPCNAGFYAPEPGTAECKACSLGMTSSQKSDSCDSCLINTFSATEGSPGCSPCLPGWETTTTGEVTCTKVAYGHYRAQNDITKPCDPGFYSDIIGASSCKTCERGHFTRGYGSVTCEPCPIGTYAQSQGSVGCDLCPQGTITASLGSNSKSQCIPIPEPINYDAFIPSTPCDEMLMLDVTETDATKLQAILTRRQNQIGNGICNGGPWNTEQCGYDGGDCCPGTCVIPVEESNTQALRLRCTQETMICVDPSQKGIPPPNCERRALSFPDVFDRLLQTTAKKGDGYCDLTLNNLQNQFDGGDCCWQTCVKNPSIPASCTELNHCLQPDVSDDISPQLQFSQTPISNSVVKHEDQIPNIKVSSLDNDPCFDFNVQYNEVKQVTGSCPAEFTLTKTWSSTDSSGNSISKSIVVTVDPSLGDTTKPVITFSPSNPQSWTANTLPEPPVAIGFDNEDACYDGVVSYEQIISDVDETCGERFVATRTWMTSDKNGNTEIISVVITVDPAYQDVTPPILSFSSNPETIGIVQLEEMVPPVPAQVSATDNDSCSDLDIIFTQVKIDKDVSCSYRYTWERKWVVSDASSNVASKTVQIRVDPAFEDTEVPVLIFSEPVVDELNISFASEIPPVTQVTATDNDLCSPLEVRFEEVRIDSDCEDKYTLKRTWSVADESGNLKMRTVYIHVDFSFGDANPPVLHFPYPVPETISVEAHVVPEIPIVNVTDDDPCFVERIVPVVETQTNETATCLNEFKLERTWESTDFAGNTASFTSTIHVTDTTAPLAVPEKTYCVDPENYHHNDKKWTKIQLKANPMFEYVSNNDVCDDNPYCDDTGVVTKFLSCTSNHQVSSDDHDGTTDCFYNEEEDMLYFYIHKGLTGQEKKFHRTYTVTVEQIDACGNAITTVQTIIAYQSKQDVEPQCDQNLTFEEYFNLCSERSRRDGRCIRYINENGDSVECPPSNIKKQKKTKEYYCTLGAAGRDSTLADLAATTQQSTNKAHVYGLIGGGAGLVACAAALLVFKKSKRKSANKFKNQGVIDPYHETAETTNPAYI